MSKRQMSLKNKSILLIISGGIAAYKSLELIRHLRKKGADVRCILTQGGQQFITPLSVAALSEQHVYTDLWSLKDETEMGHIRLSREADLIVVAPASANLLARMTHGLADDLASTTLLATDKPVLVAPAMNTMMWENEATQRNVKTLRDQDVLFVGPEAGETACGEVGMGRMSEPEDILASIEFFFQAGALSGRHAIVTSGPTHEPIDPVRFIGNRSSGKQGHAIATALHRAGADVTLITGPVALADPAGVKTVHVETAQQMMEACDNALPADIAICAAAVADWRPENAPSEKIKKGDNVSPFDSMKTIENPDILKTLSQAGKKRPEVVAGFAAETDDHLNNGKTKLARKGCDILLINDVSNGKIFGGNQNETTVLIRENAGDAKIENWDLDSKAGIARRLSHLIQATLMNKNDTESYPNAAE